MIYHLLLYITLFYCYYISDGKIHNVTIISDGEINKTLLVNISKYEETILFFDYQQSNLNKVLRVRTEAFIYNSHSVLVVIKNGFDLTNDYKLENYDNFSSVKAERTICPKLSIPESDSKQIIYNETLSIELSSKSLTPILVKVFVGFIEDFILSLNDKRQVQLDINSPQLYLFQFPPKTEQIEIVIESDDSVCMIMSVQNAVCPAHMTELNAKFSGTYQTMTKRGTITLGNESYTNNAFFLVFIINSNDVSCLSKNGFIKIEGKNTTFRQKNFQVKIKKLLSYYDYLLPVFGAVGFYFMFYIVTLSISVIYNYRFLNNNVEIEVENTSVTASNPDVTHYGTIDEVADMKTIYSQQHAYHFNLGSDFDNSISSTSHDINQLASNENESFDSCSDVSSDPNLYRLNKNLYVTDLAKKSPLILNRKYFLYMWYLIIISVFYVLPVIQLVATYQNIVHVTGNEDTCYYNFRCVRPFGFFSAFNNIISNMGYVMLGILFILITYRRNILYNEEKRFRAGIFNKGIPQYYGLFYAMGMGLTMEGILSACYHICPSDINFQFDTAYMYILACLCMIKIYQIRHPDVNATAHSFYMIMAVIILFGVIGVVYNSRIFWIIFTLIYIITTIIMSLEIYYLGRWRFTYSSPKSIWSTIRINKWYIFIPTYKRRMAVIIFHIAFNLAIALYGGITAQNNFASYFLAIFMINLLMYFAFYVIMKIQYCEHISPLSIIYVVIASVCWGFAIYCFINHPTDWQRTAAMSRELNTDCIFLNFYDIHDIWHFLSSMSMFFSFLALQNLDDSLCNTDRDKIPVF